MSVNFFSSEHPIITKQTIVDRLDRAAPYSRYLAAVHFIDSVREREKV